MKLSIGLCLVAALAGSAMGCVDKEKAEEEEEEKSEETSEDEEDAEEKDEESSKKKKKKKKSKKSSDDEDDDEDDEDDDEDDEDEATNADESGDEEDFDARKLLEDDAGDASSVLDVKLPDDDKRDAPSLGGDSRSTAALGTDVRWLGAGPLVVPNPGWLEKKDPPATVLLAPDKKAGIVFAPFTTPKDGTTKVDRIVGFFKLKNPQWKKAKPVNVGPNKVPALFGSGRATSPQGKPVKLFFVLIRSGGPQNLLAIGLADDDAPEGTLKTGLNIIGSIKRR